MKKITTIVFALFMFFVFLDKSNATIMLCEYSATDVNDSKAYITIDGTYIYFTTTSQSIAYVADIDFFTIINPFAFVNETGTMLAEAETIANNGGSMWKFAVNFSKLYRVDGSTDTQTPDVIINDSNTGRALLNLYECPSRVMFGTFNSDQQDVVPLLIMGTPDTIDMSSNSYGYSTVYDLTYGRFSSGDAPSLYQPNTCMTDVDRINRIGNYYNFNSNVPKDELLFLSQIYAKRGYDATASEISSKYAPGSECYENNPDMQSVYNDLKSKVDYYLTNYSDQFAINDVSDCKSILGDPNEQGSFAYYLNYTIKFIQYLGPILVIVLSTFDQVKAVTSGEPDEIKKSTQKNIKRLIFAVLLFFTATIINILLHTFGFEACNIGNGGVV